MRPTWLPYGKEFDPQAARPAPPGKRARSTHRGQVQHQREIVGPRRHRPGAQRPQPVSTRPGADTSMCPARKRWTWYNTRAAGSLCVNRQAADAHVRTRLPLPALHAPGRHCSTRLRMFVASTTGSRMAAVAWLAASCCWHLPPGPRSRPRQVPQDPRSAASAPAPRLRDGQAETRLLQIFRLTSEGAPSRSPGPELNAWCATTHFQLAPTGPGRPAAGTQPPIAAQGAIAPELDLASTRQRRRAGRIAHRDHASVWWQRSRPPRAQHSLAIPATGTQLPARHRSRCSAVTPVPV